MLETLNAIVVIYKTGSGGQLTSRCCHEITWPFLLVFAFCSWRNRAVFSSHILVQGSVLKRQFICHGKISCLDCSYSFIKRALPRPSRAA
jgi:hypothetical protein